jgi:hypothetical protein
MQFLRPLNAPQEPLPKRRRIRVGRPTTAELGGADNTADIDQTLQVANVHSEAILIVGESSARNQQDAAPFPAKYVADIFVDTSVARTPAPNKAANVHTEAHFIVGESSASNQQDAAPFLANVEAVEVVVTCVARTPESNKALKGGNDPPSPLAQFLHLPFHERGQCHTRPVSPWDAPRTMFRFP